MPNLQETLREINKTNGVGSLEQISKLESIEIERIPTGCFSLDWVMGGGLPSGRVIEIYGMESSGKTMLSLFIIREIQKRGGKAAFFDVENAFSPEFGKAIGVDIDKLIFSQETSMTKVLDWIVELVKTGELDIIVLDSVASLLPDEELEESVGKQNIALQARMMSRGLRKLVGIASKTKTSIIFLNQIRQKVGVFYGDPNTTSGGLALKFFSSIRIQVKKGKNIEEKEEVIGNVMKIEVKKNKVGPPFRTTEFDLIYKAGVDVVSDTFNFAVSSKVITKEGNTYSFEKMKLGVGQEQAKEALKSNKELLAKLNKTLTAK